MITENVFVSTPKSGLSLSIEPDAYKRLESALGFRPYFRVERARREASDNTIVVEMCVFRENSSKRACRFYRQSNAPNLRIQMRNVEQIKRIGVVDRYRRLTGTLEVSEERATLTFPGEGGSVPVPETTTGHRSTEQESLVLMSVMGKQFSFNIPVEEAFELALEYTRKGY